MKRLAIVTSAILATAGGFWTLGHTGPQICLVGDREAPMLQKMGLADIDAETRVQPMQLPGDDLPNVNSTEPPPTPPGGGPIGVPEAAPKKVYLGDPESIAVPAKQTAAISAQAAKAPKAERSRPGARSSAERRFKRAMQKGGGAWDDGEPLEPLDDESFNDGGYYGGPTDPSGRLYGYQPKADIPTTPQVVIERHHYGPQYSGGYYWGSGFPYAAFAAGAGLVIQNSVNNNTTNNAIRNITIVRTPPGAPVPLPSAGWMFGFAAGCLILRGRRHG